MPHVLWSRSVEGKAPDLLLGEDCVLLHRTAASGEAGGTEVIGFDLDGGRRWSRPGWRVLLTLPGNRFLVNTPDGCPLVIDSDGAVLHRWQAGGVERAERQGGTLLLAGKEQVWAADLELSRLWQFHWPGRSEPVIDCFVEGAFFGASADGLWRCAPGGPLEVISPLPADLIAASMNGWEQTTGNSALAGWYSRPGMTDFAPFQMGDRPGFFFWRAGWDEGGQQFFLANAVGPHLLLCLDRSGRPRWCRYVNPGCCGGVPSRLPNGLLVVSSGCGGILSWLDDDGNLLFQSEPHEGVGLATAYTSDVRILPGGKCLAEGGPGLVAYGPIGERLWVFASHCYRIQCDPAGQFLVGCYWADKQPNGPPWVYLEFIRGL